MNSKSQTDWKEKLEQAMLDQHLIVAIDIIENEISKARDEGRDEGIAVAMDNPLSIKNE